MVAGTVRDVSFLVPASITVQTPTSYSVSLKGFTFANISFSSSNSEILTIIPPTRIILSPKTGQQGQLNESVAITGQSTHFVPGTTTADFGAGITVASLTVNSAISDQDKKTVEILPK